MNTTKIRHRPRYIAPGVMADSVWRNIHGALIRLEECHERHADCHPSNHAQWERVALFRLRQSISLMLADLEASND